MQLSTLHGKQCDQIQQSCIYNLSKCINNARSCNSILERRGNRWRMMKLQSTNKNKEKDENISASEIKTLCIKYGT